jgi:hypothetical protein
MADEWLDSVLNAPEEQPRQKSRATNSSRTTSKILDNAQGEALIGWIKRVKERCPIFQMSFKSNHPPVISSPALAKPQWIVSSKDYPRT